MCREHRRKQPGQRSKAEQMGNPVTEKWRQQAAGEAERHEHRQPEEKCSEAHGITAETPGRPICRKPEGCIGAIPSATATSASASAAASQERGALIRNVGALS